MSRLTLQSVDLKIESVRNNLIWLAWAIGLNLAFLTLSFRPTSGVPSRLDVWFMSAQLAFLGLSLPFMVVLGTNYVELLLQKYHKQ